MELTWEQVIAWRSRRHHLHERADAKHALDIVHDLCGLHAQVMSSAELTLWARVNDLPSDIVSKALWDDRSLIKCWAMRGTLHLLPASDYWTWQSALETQYERFTKGAWIRASGVKPDELERLVAAIGEALDGRELLRAELIDAVAHAHSGSPKVAEHLANGFGSMLKPAAFMGKICHAPGEGNKVRFTNPKSWLAATAPAGDAPGPDAAAEQAARWFLHQQGPATRDEFARWWGVQPAPAGRVLKRLGDELTEATLEGDPVYVLSADADAIAAAEPVRSTRLLPAFDQYVIAATRHCTKLMPGDYKDAVYRAQGWISAVLFVDGRMAGIWSFERKGATVSATIEPWQKLPKNVRAEAEDEAESLAAFMGGALELNWV